MSPELDEKLCKTFPLLYADRCANMRGTAMCWGFSCGDGWFDLIWRLSEKLEVLIKEVKDKLTPEEVGWGYVPRASQVKEKYGGLRFYMSTETEAMSKAIADAERKAYKTCEVCGKPGKTNTSGWLRTLCRVHRKESDDR